MAQDEKQDEKQEDQPDDGGLHAAREALTEVYKNVKIGDLKDCLTNKPVILDAKTEPKKALEILIKNNIRAAPVREHGEYVGVLDLRDMVKFAVQHYKESLPAEDQEEQSKEEKEAMSFLTTAPVISTNTLKYLSRMVPFRVVKQSALVTDVVKVFSSGAHIVGITKDSGKCEVVSICTQGQLFQSLCKLWKNMLQGGDSPVQECKLMALKTAKYIKTPVKTISSDVKAIEAFEKMSQYNLSGLAVVDKEGRLIGNTSATDIKLWLVKSISLEFKIEKFLQLVLQGHVNEKAPVVCSTLKTSVGLALDKFRATRYHRLWIVDDKSVPLGVLAITDVYKFLSDVPK